MHRRLRVWLRRRVEDQVLRDGFVDRRDRSAIDGGKGADSAGRGNGQLDPAGALHNLVELDAGIGVMGYRRGR